MTPAKASGWLDRTHIGDCRDLLRQMTLDGVVANLCVTSPPYFRLRSYLPPDHPDKRLEIGTEATPAAFIASLVDVFRYVHRLLSSDGTLWIVMGDSYAATGKSGGGRQGERWNAYGAQVTGPRGGRWSPPPLGLKVKDLIGIPWMLAFALRRDGWYLRQDIIWAKPNPMPESVRDRCTRSHEYLFLLSKSRRYHFDPDAISEPSVDPRGPGNIRPVRQPPGERSSGPNGNLRGRLHQIGARTTRRKRDVWTIATRPLLPLTQAAFAADDTREREHLAAIVRQIDMLERLARQSSAAALAQRSRYYFDYRRLDADIRRIRAGVTDYLNPLRAQPRDPAALDGQYRREAGDENADAEAGK